MDSMRATVAAVVGFILAVTLLSGPLVGAVDLTDERERGLSGGINTGSAEIEVLSFPNEATITKGRFGSDIYYLRVPDARIDVRSVDQQPSLIYKVQVDTLYRTVSTVQFLSTDATGESTIAIEDQTIDPEELEAGRYNATISLTVRGDETITLREESVMIEVDG